MYSFSRYNKFVKAPKSICPSSPEVVLMKNSTSFCSRVLPVAVWSDLSPSVASATSNFPLPSASISLNFSTIACALQNS